MKELSIKELHDLQLHAALDYAAICKKHNIPYYLIAGCAIGSLRHGGFIPWDEDMDFAMMRKDYERFIAVCETELDTEKYRLQNYRNDSNCPVALTRFCIKNTLVKTASTDHLHACNNIYFDIFPLDNVPDDNRARIRQKKELLWINQLILHKIGYRLKDRAKWKQILHDLLAFVLRIVPFSTVIKWKERIMMRHCNETTKCVCSMASKYSYDKQTMPREYYGTPTPTQFENTTFDAPEQLHMYLTKLYGDYMQLPPEEKRKLHHDGYYVIQ